MGAWDDGPFDNDSAADWCGELQQADPSARGAMVRTALTSVALNTGYLDYDDAAVAVAAAAIVASRLPAGEPHAPDFVLAGEALHLDEGLPKIAVQALDRVVGGDSEWRELWGEPDASEFPQIARLRAVLSAPL